MAKKEPRTSVLAYLGILNRPGSSVSKKKQAVLKEAIEGEGGIRQLEKYQKENVGTSDVQKRVAAATGETPESDWEKRKRERAQKARREMTLLNGNK